MYHFVGNYALMQRYGLKGKELLNTEEFIIKLTDEGTIEKLPLENNPLKAANC